MCERSRARGCASGRGVYDVFVDCTQGVESRRPACAARVGTCQLDQHQHCQKIDRSFLFFLPLCDGVFALCPLPRTVPPFSPLGVALYKSTSTSADGVSRQTVVEGGTNR